ncbi:MAG: hypothetical protein KTR32_34285 [Granulosicoccus sp.]|nr:hypothetical protein [Granulosicoccus sp.]
MKKTGIWLLGIFCFGLMAASISYSALLDEILINEDGTVNVPGGTIARSLTDQIGSGRGDRYTPESSIYIIKRDPFRSIRRGRQLFQRKFSVGEGLGPRVNVHSQGDIIRDRLLGAGFADSCSACHGNPKGSAGVGGNVATFPDGRDAPHLFGLGIVEQIGNQITEELRSDRAILVAESAKFNNRMTMEMWANNVYFGKLIAYPDGTVDTSQLEGIDADLRVRPFFAEGVLPSIREFVVGALKAEMGLETWDPILCKATDPDKPQPMQSPTGYVFDASQDFVTRPPVCDAWVDNDGDGIVSEFDPALVDHLEFYLFNYFKPATMRESTPYWLGLRHMTRIGCTDCHKKDHTIHADRRVADVETRYDEKRGIFNQLFATAIPQFEVVNDGDAYPLLLPKKSSFEVENIFTDFKRHDLGPKFWERDYDGSIKKYFMTEPLWGVGTTAPYGHDGRSISLDQVIRRHGGEAQEARDRYVNLSSRKRRRILEFLNSLVLFPPDDTASNLNPGDPYADNP